VSGERIGIIGLGLVGSALAERLMAAGFDVSGYDINPARVEEFQAAGGASAPTALEAARGCPLVLLSLPTSEIGAAVIEQIEPGLAPGVTVVDTTTGEPEQMAAFGARLAGRGVFYLDASIGGSSKQVREGEAMVICGGEPQAFAACAELFRVCFRQAFHVGECSGRVRGSARASSAPCWPRGCLTRGRAALTRRGRWRCSRPGRLIRAQWT
jgi:3-hydroxyisobutyrate dehydrogenase-like beta-hydroxyacid dehydrogenase